jgi:hypothetical protein
VCHRRPRPSCHHELRSAGTPPLRARSRCCRNRSRPDQLSAGDPGSPHAAWSAHSLLVPAAGGGSILKKIRGWIRFLPAFLFRSWVHPYSSNDLKLSQGIESERVVNIVFLCESCGSFSLHPSIRAVPFRYAEQFKS